MTKFNVGDRVLVTKPTTTGGLLSWRDDMDRYDGTFQTIGEIDGEGHTKLAGCGGWYFSPSWLTLFHGATVGPGTIHKLTGEETTSMSTLSNAKLSADERLARYQGFVNSDGSLASAGRDLVAEFIWQERGTEILYAFRAAAKTVANDEKAMKADLSADVAE